MKLSKPQTRAPESTSRVELQELEVSSTQRMGARDIEVLFKVWGAVSFPKLEHITVVGFGDDG